MSSVDVVVGMVPRLLARVQNVSLHGSAVGEPRARIYFAEEDVLRPGWYVQFYSEDHLDRLPLWQADLEDVEAARTEAAWMLGCRPDEIQVGGELLDWPKKSR